MENKISKGEVLISLLEDHNLDLKSAERVFELAKAIDLSKLVRKQVQVQGKNGTIFIATRWVDPTTGKTTAHDKQSEDIESHSAHDDKALAKVKEIVNDDDKGKVQKVRDLIGLGIYDRKQLMLLADCTSAVPYNELKAIGGVVDSREDEEGEASVPEQPAAEGGSSVEPSGEINTEGLSEKKLKKILDYQRSKKREESGLTYKDFWNSYESTLKGVIIDGYPKSLIAYGTGGLGKTFTLDTVMEQLQVRKYDAEINPSKEQYDGIYHNNKSEIDHWLNTGDSSPLARANKTIVNSTPSEKTIGSVFSRSTDKPTEETDRLLRNVRLDPQAHIKVEMISPWESHPSESERRKFDPDHVNSKLRYGTGNELLPIVSINDHNRYEVIEGINRQVTAKYLKKMIPSVSVSKELHSALAQRGYNDNDIATYATYIVRDKNIPRQDSIPRKLTGIEYANIILPVEEIKKSENIFRKMRNIYNSEELKKAIESFNLTVTI